MKSHRYGRPHIRVQHPPIRCEFEQGPPTRARNATITRFTANCFVVVFRQNRYPSPTLTG